MGKKQMVGDVRPDSPSRSWGERRDGATRSPSLFIHSTQIFDSNARPLVFSRDAHEEFVLLPRGDQDDPSLDDVLLRMVASSASTLTLFTRARRP